MEINEFKFWGQSAEKITLVIGLFLVLFGIFEEFSQGLDLTRICPYLCQIGDRKLLPRDLQQQPSERSATFWDQAF